MGDNQHSEGGAPARPDRDIQKTTLARNASVLRDLVQEGNIEKVTALLDLLKEKENIVNQAAPDGTTALHIAAATREDAFRPLLEAERKAGYSTDMVKLLLEAGADPIARDKDGETPLDKCRDGQAKQRSKGGPSTPAMDAAFNTIMLLEVPTVKAEARKKDQLEVHKTAFGPALNEIKEAKWVATVTGGRGSEVRSPDSGIASPPPQEDSSLAAAIQSRKGATHGGRT